MTTFLEFKQKIRKIDDYPAVIDLARIEYNVNVSETAVVYLGTDIPLNLEREYFDHLLEVERFSEARIVIENLKSSYTGAEAHNLIEQYEYRLHTVQWASKMFQEKLQAAKVEFSQHTILIISIVVGTITIFGAANNIFKAKNIEEAIITFLTISLTIIFLVWVAFTVSKK